MDITTKNDNYISDRGTNYCYNGNHIVIYKGWSNTEWLSFQAKDLQSYSL